MSNISPSPVVSSNTPTAPLVDLKNGQISFAWLQWFIAVGKSVNLGLSKIGISLQLPFPTPATLGGVNSGTAPAGQFMTGIAASGAPTFGTPTTTGFSGTITTAALTGGGTQGSMTFLNGILTAQTPAT